MRLNKLKHGIKFVNEIKIMTKAFLYLGIISLLGSMYSCSSSEQLFQSPSFLASHNLPDKPSFENNEEFADYYSEDYTSLTALNNTRPSETTSKTTQPGFNIFNSLTPSFSLGFSYGNYFGYNPYDPWGYCSNSYGAYGQYPYGYSYHANNMNSYYWGPPGTYTYQGNNNDNYPTYVPLAPRLPKSIYTMQSIHIPYTKVNRESNHGKINFAKPVNKSKKISATKTTYSAKSSYSYTTNKRKDISVGYYRPPSAPPQYSPSSNQGYSNIETGSVRTRPNSSAGSSRSSGASGSSTNYPRSNSSSSSSGYKPPRSSGGKGSLGGRGGSGGNTPRQNNSSSGSASPRK